MAGVLENELFEAFAEASESVYVYVCDVKNDLSRWSKHSVEYFGLPGEYIENAAQVWLEKVHPEDRRSYLDDITAVFSGAKVHHDCQYRAMNRFGDYVWLECKGIMLRGPQGDMSVFAGMMTRLDTQNKYDSLTGLMTIHSYYSRDFTDCRGAALLIGIDEFRKVVSNYSYSFGDEVLVKLAGKLKKLCPDKWSMYRMNGDEFLIICADGSREDIYAYFEMARNAAANLQIEDGRHISLALSAGAVLYPENGASREEILSNLEHSLEYSKSRHRGSLSFYSDKIAARQRRIQELKQDLKACIADGFKGFELYFQPLVNPNNGKVKGCEALLRWKGNKITDSNPGEFIKILEDDGGIKQVGRWVMREAVRYQKKWADSYGDICVSFNVSYQQFLEEDFIPVLLDTVKEYGVDPSSMIVELTESCQVEQPEDLAAIFRQLLESGFQVALDDFGTAYSSLEMLKKLPANFIKIEHSFVRELAVQGHEIDYIIIENLLSLCKRLDCKAIIEGVENKEVDDIVHNMDATYLQGYYYSRPVCAAEFEEMLKRSNGENGL